MKNLKKNILQSKEVSTSKTLPFKHFFFMSWPHFLDLCKISLLLSFSWHFRLFHALNMNFTTRYFNFCTLFLHTHIQHKLIFRILNLKGFVKFVLSRMTITFSRCFHSSTFWWLMLVLCFKLFTAILYHFNYL